MARNNNIMYTAYFMELLFIFYFTTTTDDCNGIYDIIVNRL